MRSIRRSWIAGAVAVALGGCVFPAATVLRASAAGPAACITSGTMQFSPPLNVTLGSGYAFTFIGSATCTGLVNGSVDLLSPGSLSGGGDCPSGGAGGEGGGTVATCLSVLNGGAIVEGGDFNISSSPLGTCGNGTWLQIGLVFEGECTVDGLGVLSFTAVATPSPAFQAPIANVIFTGVLAATL